MISSKRKIEKSMQNVKSSNVVRQSAKIMHIVGDRNDWNFESEKPFDWYGRYGLDHCDSGSGIVCYIYIYIKPFLGWMSGPHLSPSQIKHARPF